jgi:hypothetical protein
MNYTTEVTAKDIENLNEPQFTELINKLLHIETRSQAVYVKSLNIGSKEDTADGGKDGELILGPEFETGRFIQFHKNFFQIKARKMSTSACQTELLKDKQIKSKIREDIENGYAYVMFIKYNHGELTIDSYKTKIKATFKSNGCDEVRVQIIDANCLKDWVNTYPSIIRFVKSCIGDSFICFRYLDECLEFNKESFVSDKALDRQKEIIKNLKDPNYSLPYRVIGNSGIGKTHFIIKTLAAEKYIKCQVLYCELGNSSDCNQIINLINKYKNSHCILVVDNCSLQHHKKIQANINDSKTFKLITIDSNSDGKESYKNYLLIELVSSDQNQVVTSILEQVITGNNRAQYLSYLIKHCEGYPLLAIKIRDAISLDGIEYLDLGKLLDEADVYNLLFKNILESDQAKYKNVLMALSFFSFVTFISNENPIVNESDRHYHKIQFEFLKKHFLYGVLESEFSKICHDLIKLSFLESKGTLIAVKPLPLAAYMIQEAVGGHINLNNEFRPALEELNKSSELALQELNDSFYIQIKKIVTSNISNLLDVINRLYGDNNSPFTMAENVFTSGGSLLLRYLAEIIPERTVDIINNVVQNLTIDELLLISGQMRRNLIWALEKLYFLDKTFNKASKLLLKFASAENESISNNATGQFTHLFQLYLPGTQANYLERVKVINWALNNEYKQFYIPVLIKAICRAFNTDNFIGNGISPNDINHLNEYQPQSNEDVLVYWKALLDLLKEYFDTFTANEVYEAFNNSIVYALINSKQLSVVQEFIDLFIRSDIPQPYTELINKLKSIKGYNKRISASEIDNLLVLISPKSLLGRIQTQIINPSYGFDEKDFKEKERCTVEIAKELFGTDSYKECIDLLLSTNSGLVSELGTKVAKINPEFAKDILAKILVDSFSTSNIEIAFISGMLWGLEDNRFNKEYLECLGTKGLNNVVFGLVGNLRINRDIFTVLLNLKQKNNLTNDCFLRINFTMISAAEQKWFMTELQKLGDVGIQKILEFLNYNIRHNTIKISVWVELIESIIANTNLFLICRSNGLDYTLYDILDKLLVANPDSKLLISKSLYEYCKSQVEHYYSMYHWSNILPKLIEQCYSLIWNQYLGELFLQDLQSCFYIKQLLNLNSLFETPERAELLLNWCIENKTKKAHVLIARHAWIFDKEDKCYSFIIELIKTFNTNDELLDAIFINMQEYSWQGNVSEYYQKCLKQLHNLKAEFIYDDFVLEWIEKCQKYFESQYNTTKQQEEEFSLVTNY